MKKDTVIRPSGIITLITDFGLKDTFVGQMKGVILSINQEAKIIDITHQITPFSIVDASNAISSTYKYYPEGSIHIVIADPGVGSSRKGLLIQCNGHFFIGPDNGVFSGLLKDSPHYIAVSLNVKENFNKNVSHTFHGRDVFAPVAGRLSLGKSIYDFGDVIDSIIMIELAKPVISDNSIIGTVKHIDNFGNVITNISHDLIGERTFTVNVNEFFIRPVRYYQEAEGKGLSCLINSAGYLELFIYQDRCNSLLSLTNDAKIIVRFD